MPLLFTEKLRFHCWNRSEEVWRCKKLDIRPSYYRRTFLCERCACTGSRIPKLFQTFTMFRKRVYNTYYRTWWQYEASKQVFMSFSRKQWENLKYFGFGVHMLDYYRLYALLTFVSSSATQVATIYTNWDLFQRIVSSFQPHSSSLWFLGLSCNPTVQFISLQCFWPTVYNSSTTNMIYETHFARWWYHWDALSSATLYRLAPSQPKRLQSLINRSYPKAIKVSPRWYLYCNQQFCASSKVIITSNMAKCDQPWVTSHHRTHGSRIETKRSSLRSQIKGDQ